MNMKISVLVIFFCLLYKILGFNTLLLIILSLVLFLLSIVICLLGKASNKTFQELLYTNPLYDSKRTLGLKYSEKSGEALNLKRNDPLTAKFMRPLSGNAENDEVLHKILDHVFRDFIDSWYSIISENKEFSIEIRLLTEDCLSNLIKRIKQSPLMAIITTQLIDDVAAHSKAYQDALKMMKESQKGPKNLNKFNSSLHRRNKSESDVTWNTPGSNAQKKIANSTFYYVQNDEKLLDPKRQLIETFFDITSDVYKKEVTDDKALEKHLISIMETCLYYTFDPNSFSCDPLRTLVSSLIGSLVAKLISNNISDPDFLNLQIAKLFMNNPPPSEWLIKTIRQTDDLSELLAVRHLITREMDLKYKDKNCMGEISSMSYTQKIIDLRITSLQTKDRSLIEKSSSKLPRLTLDEILSKDIALSYYLDYLQVMNLQKYVIFYCLAQDWKHIAIEKISQSASDEKLRLKVSKDLRDRAFELFKEFLVKPSPNALQIDQGLVEVLHIKIKDTFINPDPSWFDSLLKYLYEKLKNEHVFLQNFYESPAYKKLIAELEDNELDAPDVKFSAPSSQAESGSDSNSGDYLLDELDLLEDEGPEGASLGVNIYKHQRSHSDTGVLLDRKQSPGSEMSEKKLSAKIINTAINSDGKFAVYAIQVVTNETNRDGLKQQKSWHVYRRYKKFLELKNLLAKYFRNISLPFPKKQTFHNTSRDLLERRMVILNEFLNIICNRAETDTLVLAIVLEFLEPDNDDRQIHGTKVVKHLVNPIKSGMKTIKSVPDNVIGGLSKIFVTRNSEKFEINEMMDANSADLPALTSLVNLLNCVFDLDSRSMWLKRGIQRLISAPFVSQSINKKIKEIVQKNILDPTVIHGVLCGILNNTWPNGTFQESIPREDVTKLRTRMAAKIAIFAFFTDDLKHILGSETTKLGLVNFYEMLQNHTLNKRLILILLDRILTAALPTDNLTKHVMNK